MIQEEKTIEEKADHAKKTMEQEVDKPVIDRQYLIHLSNRLYFRLSRDQINKIMAELNDMGDLLKKYSRLVHPNVSPADYPRVKNCGQLRKDIPAEKKDANYLGSAKVVEKYVVGK